MPRRDGTGSMGMGSMTGRGMGYCNAAKALGVIGGFGPGSGLGCRRGFGRNGFNNTINPEDQKYILMQQKTILQNRLDFIDNQLNKLQDDK